MLHFPLRWHSHRATLRRCSIPIESAFTLLELLATICILIALAALALPNLREYLSRAREAVCLTNMRSITVGLHSYLIDHDAIWPQGPPKKDRMAWEKFWTCSLESYDISPRVWQCPEITAQLTQQTNDKDKIPQVHYTPTSFPPVKGIVYTMPGQPWLIEDANAHGKGSLVAFQDSVKPLFKILAENGVR